MSEGGILEWKQQRYHGIGGLIAIALITLVPGAIAAWAGVNIFGIEPTTANVFTLGAGGALFIPLLLILGGS